MWSYSREAYIMLLGSLLSIVLACICWPIYYYANPVRQTASGLTLEAVSPETVIGYKANWQDTKNAFVLVEFADYQCPPCAVANSRLDAMKRQRPNLRLVFRNYPLVGIHHNAMSAAILAECARQQGKFWQMHDALFKMQDKLDAGAMRNEVMRLGLDAARLDRDAKDSAQRIVEQDMRQAEMLAVHGTPTFFLCRRDGKVYRLSELGQAEEFLR